MARTAVGDPATASRSLLDEFARVQSEIARLESASPDGDEFVRRQLRYAARTPTDLDALEDRWRKVEANEDPGAPGLPGRRMRELLAKCEALIRQYRWPAKEATVVRGLVAQTQHPDVFDDAIATFKTTWLEAYALAARRLAKTEPGAFGSVRDLDEWGRRLEELTDRRAELGRQVRDLQARLREQVAAVETAIAALERAGV